MNALNMLWSARNEEILLRRRQSYVHRRFMKTINEMPDALFIQQFRLNKATFKALVNEIRRKTFSKGLMRFLWK